MRFQLDLREPNPSGTSNRHPIFKMRVPHLSSLAVMKGLHDILNLDMRIKVVLRFEQRNLAEIWCSSVVHEEFVFFMVKLLLERIDLTEFIESLNKLICRKINRLLILLDEFRLVFQLKDNFIESFNLFFENFLLNLEALRVLVRNWLRHLASKISINLKGLSIILELDG